MIWQMLHRHQSIKDSIHCTENRKGFNENPNYISISENNFEPLESFAVLYGTTSDN